jgi:hypothetical protein
MNAIADQFMSLAFAVTFILGNDSINSKVFWLLLMIFRSGCIIGTIGSAFVLLRYILSGLIL